MQHIILYAATAIIFLGVDALWLSRVMGPMFRRELGDMLRPMPSLGVAAGFYALYVVGILWFASAGGLDGKPMGRVALDAALFGFFAYGTYEMTNMATLNRWTWGMVAADMAWGTLLTMGAALAGLWVTRMILPGT
jgi:uncharacterized membrane protein